MATENLQTQSSGAENGETNRPDYIAKQYRQVRVEDGWKTRKERIGVAWKGENGAICFRASGIQIIDGDVHLFPVDEEAAQQ